METNIQKQLESIANSLRMIAYSLASQNYLNIDRTTSSYDGAMESWERFDEHIRNQKEGPFFSREEFFVFFSDYGTELDALNLFFEDCLTDGSLFHEVEALPGIYCLNDKKED